MLATHERLIHVNTLVRREQDEADEPNEGNYEDEAPDFDGIAIIVSIYTKL